MSAVHNNPIARHIRPMRFLDWRVAISHPTATNATPGSSNTTAPSEPLEPQVGSTDRRSGVARSRRIAATIMVQVRSTAASAGHVLPTVLMLDF